MKFFILSILYCLTTFCFSQEKEGVFSIYFEHNKDKLTTAHYTIIDSIQSWPYLDTPVHKDEIDIHIKGYTNSIGDSLYNLNLSKRRAASVAQMLEKYTIISSQGYGELETESAKNRKVDILVHYKKDHVAIANEVIIPPKIKTPAITTPTPAKAAVFDRIPKKGDKITLEGIMFYADRDVITDESVPSLNNLIAFLEKNSTIQFKLIGHICCGDTSNPGRDLLNVRTGKRNLSEARARAVHNYLAKQGIDTKRMRYIGMAFRQPTGLSSEFDRRVEIEITAVD